MKMDDMVLVSVDDHFVEPADMFDRHLPEKWKSRAPRFVHKSDGTDVWTFEGQQLPTFGLNAVVGRVPEEYGMEPTSLSQLRRGCYDVHARIDDMNAGGVLGSLCFATFPGMVGELFAKQEDKELARVMVQAYNDWMLHEWCGSYPLRLIPCALPMLWDPKLMAAEIRRMSELGCHAMAFPDWPPGVGRPSLHDDYWEPVWKAADECGTILCMHIGSGTGMPDTDENAAVEIMIASGGVSLFRSAINIVYSEFLQRHPNLKFALSEGGTGWVPYLLERMDYCHRHHHQWTYHTFPDGKLPSDMFRDHFMTCLIDDPVGIATRHRLGIHNISWECDYPHSDSTWPNCPERLLEALEGECTDEEIDLITHRNAMTCFRYDPLSEIPRAKACVGALRASARAAGVDTTPRAGLGGKPPSDYERGFATMGDLMKQVASAFAVPFDREGHGVVEDATQRREILSGGVGRDRS